MAEQCTAGTIMEPSTQSISIHQPKTRRPCRAEHSPQSLHHIHNFKELNVHGGTIATQHTHIRTQSYRPTPLLVPILSDIRVQLLSKFLWIGLLRHIGVRTLFLGHFLDLFGIESDPQSNESVQVYYGRRITKRKEPQHTHTDTWNLAHATQHLHPYNLAHATRRIPSLH